MRRFPPLKDRAEAARWRAVSGAAVRWGGALIAVGSVLPWAWVPLAGLRLPLPGALGWGALTLLLGAWLYRRPAWWSAGLASGIALWVAWGTRATLPAAISRLLLGLEMRVQPLNNLLAHFGIAPLMLFDFGIPWSQIRGPGTAFVIAGALLALLGAVVGAVTGYTAAALSRCGACGNRNRSGRITAFCVSCGAPMPGERACPTCHTLAEPGDACCGTCGTRLHNTGLPDASLP